MLMVEVSSSSFGNLVFEYNLSSGSDFWEIIYLMYYIIAKYNLRATYNNNHSIQMIYTE